MRVVLSKKWKSSGGSEHKGWNLIQSHSFCESRQQICWTCLSLHASDFDMTWLSPWNENAALNLKMLIAFTEPNLNWDISRFSHLNIEADGGTQLPDS